MIHDTKYRIQCKIQKNNTEYRILYTQNTGHMIRYRIHHIGYTIQDIRYRIHDTGYTIQDTRYRIHDTGYTIHDTTYDTLRIGNYKSLKESKSNVYAMISGGSDIVINNLNNQLKLIHL